MTTMAELDALAAARAADLGLPTRALEDWRYVDAAPLGAALDAPSAVAEEDLRALLPPGPALAIVDGALRLAAGFGAAPGLTLATPEAPLVGLWAAGLATEADHGAVWSLAHGGLRQVVRVAGEARLALLFVATGGRSGGRVRIEVAPGARLHLAVRHQARGAALACPGIELLVGRGATVHVGEVSDGPWHSLVTAHGAEVAQDATLAWIAGTAGGALLRQRVVATLAGRGAGAALHTATLLRGVAGPVQAHQLTRVIHGAPDTRSTQIVKAVLHERSATSFDGLVRILPGAIGSDAQQQHRCLLCADSARADTRPQLDIKADDVKAAHGATIGQLDADELLYLRQRGIPLARAMGLLTTGFTGEVLDQLGDPWLQDAAAGWA